MQGNILKHEMLLCILRGNLLAYCRGELARSSLDGRLLVACCYRVIAFIEVRYFFSLSASQPIAGLYSQPFSRL